MKQIAVFILINLLLLTTASPIFAYVIKLYNDGGTQIGTARKTGDDYEIYDLDGNRVEDYETFFASSGMNVKPVSNYDPKKYWIKTGKYSSRPLFFIPTPVLKIKKPN